MLTVIADPVNFYLVTLEESPEIALRGSGLFFYKGFLYLGIAVVFLITLQGRRWRLLTLFVLLALALSLTRGFILSTAAAVTLGLVIQRRWRLLAVTLAAFSMVVFVYWGYLPSVDDDVAEQRETSNAQRLDDMAFIADNATVQTVLIGQGFGSPINGRTLIENTFLWAFWRMGLAGVAFWLSPLILCAAYFVKVARTSPMHGLACAFFCSTVLVYVQTMTNPYLSNPIGLSFVIVSIFSLRTLARSRPHVVICASSRSSNDDRPLTPRPRPVRDAS